MGTEVEPSSMAKPVKFEDVQGVQEAKAELEEVVQFLKGNRFRPTTDGE